MSGWGKKLKCGDPDELRQIMHICCNYKTSTIQKSEPKECLRKIFNIEELETFWLDYLQFAIYHLYKNQKFWLMECGQTKIHKNNEQESK